MPIGNSTDPENVTEFPWSLVHFASEGFTDPQALALGSTNRKDPFPPSCASKRSDRCSLFGNLISIFQVPIRFGDCDWAIAVEDVWAIKLTIKLKKTTNEARGFNDE